MPSFVSALGAMGYDRRLLRRNVQCRILESCTIDGNAIRDALVLYRKEERWFGCRVKWTSDCECR